MKRILVFALLIAMCISVYAAVGSVSGPAIGDLGTPQQTVELDLAKLDSFAFGFSTSEAHTASEDNSLTATKLALSSTNSAVADNSAEGSDLYVWWDITTDESFVVKLSMSGHLTDESKAHKIGWTVEGTGDTTDPVSAIDLTSGDSESSSFITFTSDNNMHNFSGQQKLAISTVTTEDLAIDGKPAGLYTGTLTLAISSN